MIYFTVANWILLGLVVLSAVLNIRKRGWRVYVVNILWALDVLGNAIMGARGTISSRCEKGYGRYWYWTVLGRILLAIDTDHIRIPAQVEPEKTR